MWSTLTLILGASVFIGDVATISNTYAWGFPGGSDVKESPSAMWEATGSSQSGRMPGEDMLTQVPYSFGNCW